MALLRGAGGRNLSSDSVGLWQREASGGASAAGGTRRGVGVCSELDRGGLASDRPAREIRRRRERRERPAAAIFF